MRHILQIMDRQSGWDESDSHDFIDLGRFFVPTATSRSPP